MVVAVEVWEALFNARIAVAKITQCVGVQKGFALAFMKSRPVLFQLLVIVFVLTCKLKGFPVN